VDVPARDGVPNAVQLETAIGPQVPRLLLHRQQRVEVGDAVVRGARAQLFV
jgi:hypothetical protein